MRKGPERRGHPATPPRQRSRTSEGSRNEENTRVSAPRFHKGARRQPGVRDRESPPVFPDASVSFGIRNGPASTRSPDRTAAPPRTQNEAPYLIGGRRRPQRAISTRSAILDARPKGGAQAILPGYGPSSPGENAQVRACVRRPRPGLVRPPARCDQGQWALERRRPRPSGCRSARASRSIPASRSGPSKSAEEVAPRPSANELGWPSRSKAVLAGGAVGAQGPCANARTMFGVHSSLHGAKGPRRTSPTRRWTSALSRRDPRHVSRCRWLARCTRQRHSIFGEPATCNGIQRPPTRSSSEEDALPGGRRGVCASGSARSPVDGSACGWLPPARDDRRLLSPRWAEYFSFSRY